jgi:hypothetical protein
MAALRHQHASPQVRAVCFAGTVMQSPIPAQSSPALFDFTLGTA